MPKPYIQKIKPFDADKDYEISLSWTGNRSHSNRIIIQDYETNAVVFDDTVSSFSLKHTIPAHTLTNGRKYTIQAQTFDMEGNPSALSDKVLFHVFRTPDFYFRNLPENHIIGSSSFTAEINYYSADWEDISKYCFYLYDASGKQLLSSAEQTDAFFISYTYRGLDNNTAYRIRCVGVTVNGMELDTGYQEITVKFENPNQYARLYASPVPGQGCVQVATNLIIIQYNGTDSFEYIDGMIDLRDKTLYYDKGFLIKDDFTVLIRGVNLWQTADIFKMNNDGLGLTLSSRIYDEGKLRFKLTVPNGLNNYILYSDEQVFTDTDMITIAIRRKNNIYQLKVFMEIGSSPQGNLWYGTNRPPRHLMDDHDVWLDTPGETIVVNKDSYISFLKQEEPSDAILNDLWIGGD
ncbi:MAG: hypothetical protein K2P23_00520 [Lachnospiraceae bacterium]|nr:hypothetical protein [Lachnospiraceae bacterium]